MTKLLSSIILSLITLLAGIYGILSTSSLPSVYGGDIGGAVFPRLISYALIICSLFFFVREVRVGIKNKETLIEKDYLFLFTFAGLIGYVIILPSLGFLMSTALLGILLSFLAGTKNKLLLLLLPVLTSIIIYIVFVYGLNIPLPIGSIFY